MELFPQGYFLSQSVLILAVLNVAINNPSWKKSQVKCADDTFIGEYSINDWVLLENNLDCLIFFFKWPQSNEIYFKTSKYETRHLGGINVDYTFKIEKQSWKQTEKKLHVVSAKYHS